MAGGSICLIYRKAAMRYTLVLSVVLPVANMIYQYWMINRLSDITEPITLQAARMEALVSSFITIVCYGLSTFLVAKGLYQHQKPSYILYIALALIVVGVLIESLARYSIAGLGEPNPRYVAEVMGYRLFIFLPAITVGLPLLLAAFFGLLRSEKPT
jgi:hypothetical protein